MAGFTPGSVQYNSNYDPSSPYASLFSYGGGGYSPAAAPTGLDPNYVPGYNPGSTGVPTFIPNYGAAAAGVSVPKTAASPVPNVPQPQFGWNLDTLKTGLGVAQTGANIYSAFEQASIAKQQLDYAKQIGNANLANQMKSYNTTLNDRANMDAKVGGWTPEQTAAYVAANKLTGK